MAAAAWRRAVNTVAKQAQDVRNEVGGSGGSDAVIRHEKRRQPEVEQVAWHRNQEQRTPHPPG